MSLAKYKSRVCYYDPLSNREVPKNSNTYYRFDSALEMNTYQQLIKTVNPLLLQRQYKFVLIPPSSGHLGIAYIADFVLFDGMGNISAVIESKGLLTKSADLKLKLFEFRYPELYSILILAVNKTNTIRQGWLTNLIWNINQPLNNSLGFRRAKNNYLKQNNKGVK